MSRIQFNYEMKSLRRIAKTEDFGTKPLGKRAEAPFRKLDGNLRKDELS